MEETYSRSYARLYAQHWWWRARRALIIELLNGLPLQVPGAVLDVGCGDGLFFDDLERFGQVRGIEVDERLLDPDAAHRARIFTEPLGARQYETWRFELITALDVLEHIEDDRAAVRALGAMLAPGGYLVVTVPAFMSLWDRHDEINRHYRRYTREEIGRLLEPIGQIVQLRYWFHSLHVAKRVLAAVNRATGRPIAQHRLPPRWFNTLMASYYELECRALARWAPSFGTSVVAVVCRTST